MRDYSRPEPVAQAARFLASALLLLQPHLAAGELSDLSCYAGAVVLAAAAGFSLAAARARAWVAVLVLVSVPLLLRSAIGAAAVMIGTDRTAADSALLAYDRNLLLAMPAFMWSGASAYFAQASRRFLRIEPFVNGFFLALFFVLIEARRIPAYEKPVILAAAVAVLVLLEFVVLAESGPRAFRASGRERAGVALAVAAACVVAVAFLLKPFEEKAAAQGGGLIKPSMFRFDFSQYLRLESEISLSDDLVLIVRKDPDDQHSLLRRFVLSGYDRKRGFHRVESLDDAAHPRTLPDGEALMPAVRFRGTKSVEQEYYLVNFDPAAFIAINQPTKSIPFKSWDASSFASVYAAESAASEALPFELIDAEQASGIDGVRRELGDAAYAAYTDYGGDERIRRLALEFTGGAAAYWDSVQAVYEGLKFGDYRYSLKPGIAADGDQLGRFLFDARKGYCSYFAFSMTLLVRSLGIPARTAVGFFVDPATAAFGYHPVRADMAHAWVEVFFPEYGWIEYDPTTEQLAEGEEFRFSSGIAPEQFEKLMREILANRDGLQARVSEEPSGLAHALPRLAGEIAAFARRRWALFLALAWFALVLRRRCGLLLLSLAAFDPRRAAQRLADHALRRLEIAGRGRRAVESCGEYAARMDAGSELGVQRIVEGRAKALFAPSFGIGDADELRKAYRNFDERYRQVVPASRRLAAWLLPFGLPAGRAAALLLVLACLALPGDRLDAEQGDADISAAADPFIEIDELIAAERWEIAVDRLRAGAKRYPEDSRFPIALGDLFADRKLHGLAWEEYRAAERIDGNDPALLHRLAAAAGRLNMDEQAASYLERVATLRPDDRDAVGDLAWMYFKLHRLREGERFLLDAIVRLGSDPGFSMTLGTIYSDLYDYESSKRWYEQSIEEARRNGARTFEAVAQYNLSILESKHYRYSESFMRTGLSLEAADRASGHLARGELYLKRLDFSRTYAEYERAYELDVSPLSKLNLADAYLSAGRLAEARSYAANALAVTDHSWMFNYGTNRNRYRRDVHDILAKTYEGLANLERFRARTSPADWLYGMAVRAANGFRAAYHRALFREYARRSASSYAAAGQALDSLLNYYDAFGAYPASASYYLRKAAELEVSLVPAAAATYELELGVLERSVARIEAALSSLDPIWQKDLSAEGYAALAGLYAAGSAESRAAAERLFALNRGALRPAGIRLPVSLKIEADGRAARSIERTLSRSGFVFVPETVSVRFALEISISEGEARCVLTDSLRGSVVLRKALPLESLSAAARAAFSAALADSVFLAQ